MVMRQRTLPTHNQNEKPSNIQHLKKKKSARGLTMAISGVIFVFCLVFVFTLYHYRSQIFPGHFDHSDTFDEHAALQAILTLTKIDFIYNFTLSLNKPLPLNHTIYQIGIPLRKTHQYMLIPIEQMFLKKVTDNSYSFSIHSLFFLSHEESFYSYILDRKRFILDIYHLQDTSDLENFVFFTPSVSKVEKPLAKKPSLQVSGIEKTSLICEFLHSSKNAEIPEQNYMKTFQNNMIYIQEDTQEALMKWSMTVKSFSPNVSDNYIAANVQIEWLINFPTTAFTVVDIAVIDHSECIFPIGSHEYAKTDEETSPFIISVDTKSNVPNLKTYYLTPGNGLFLIDHRPRTYKVVLFISQQSGKNPTRYIYLDHPVLVHTIAYNPGQEEAKIRDWIEKFPNK